MMIAAAFAPNHTVPSGGLDAWEAPDPALRPSARLDPWLEVQVTAVTGGWSRVLCANGWSAWVDGSALVPLRLAAASPAPLAEAPGAAAAPMGLTTWMAIAGGGVVALSALLPWISLGSGALTTASANAFKAPLELLWNVQASPLAQGAASPLTIGLALVATGVAGIALVFVNPALDLVRRAAGGVAVFIASDFVRQVSTAVSQLDRAGSTRTSVFSLLGVGVYAALAGGGLILLGTVRKPAMRP